MTEDKKISERYRELGAEEPPRAVDEAILAASRRAVHVHPAPLVPPAGRRRWYFPVAAAAIIMLSVAVTWHVQLERPDPDGYIASAPAPEAPKDVLAEKKTEMQAAPQAAPPAAPPVAASRMEERARESAPAAGARAPEAARADRSLGKVAGQSAEPPEKWLERIAELRKAGKHEEADKALEAFRKRYPDYKIPESALKK